MLYIFFKGANMQAILWEILNTPDIERFWTLFIGTWVVINGVALIVSTFIGVNKNRAAIGVFSGLLLGWYGVLVTLIISKGPEKCSLCNHVIKDEWKTCPFCETPVKDTLIKECDLCKTNLDPSWKVCPICGTK